LTICGIRLLWFIAFSLQANNGTMWILSQNILHRILQLSTLFSRQPDIGVVERQVHDVD
jgi:hypothetical protein